MTIDIIHYTPAQYAELTEEQLHEVRSAQLKKNKLTAALERDKQNEKNRLMDNGVFLSALWEQICQRLTEAYTAEVDALRESLLFYLQFASRPSDEDADVAPYVIDYALTIKERTQIVKTYYDATYSDPTERFQAFMADKIAPKYVGENYSTLYDYYEELAAAAGN